MKSKNCELLAPAGNLECALAAVDAGADAVYCGLGRFNARSRAENLNLQTLGSLLDFMHSKKRKLYLTFNTLLFEDELPAAGEMLADLARLAPDALIVHDPGVLHMAKKYFPSLKVHGSTQMGIHNSAGVRAAADLGIERVILERQIPLNELERIVRNSPIEIEVFIHGSLCCSLSGRSTPSNAFSIQAILRARVRIVCNPSASCSASPGKSPCTLFQYCYGTTGILLMVKYLFKRSKVALAPPLRHTATAAAGLYCRCCLLEKNSLSSKAHSDPLGPA